MNKIYYYLITGVFLYFLLTRVLENFIHEQENFDPSLVPVSSIVTLAKVAHKLVNSDGSVIIPSNLNIDKNLTVSETADLAGLSTKLKITKGSLSPDNTKIQWGSGDGDILRFQTDDTRPQMDIYDNGLIKIYGNETIKGNLTVTGDTNLVGNLKIGNKAVLAASPTDGWIKLLKTDGSGTYTNLEKFSGDEHLTGQEMQTMLPSLSSINSATIIAQKKIDTAKEELAALGYSTIDAAAREVSTLININGGLGIEIGKLWYDKNKQNEYGNEISKNNTKINNIQPKIKLIYDTTQLLNKLREPRPDIMPGLAVNNLYSQKDTTVNKNLDVINNLTTINTINTNNTTINGILKLQTDKAIQSTDEKNRITFKADGPTIFHSQGNHVFRGGANGNTPDIMTLTGNNLTVVAPVKAVGTITANDILIGGRSLFSILPWK